MVVLLHHKYPQIPNAQTEDASWARHTLWEGDQEHEQQSERETEQQSERETE